MIGLVSNLPQRADHNATSSKRYSYNTTFLVDYFSITTS